MDILDTVYDYFIEQDLTECFLHNLKREGNSYADEWNSGFISEAFSWSSTNEGGTFWNTHDEALIELCKHFYDESFDSLELITLLEQHINPITMSYEYW